MKKKSFHRFLTMALSFALAACASGGGAEAEPGAQADEDRVAVEVDNDLVPGMNVVVWMVPQTGSRRRLGSIPPNGRETFNYLPGARSMDHRLIAETDRGEERSNTFNLVGVNSIRWEVSSPTVSLQR